MADSGRLPGAGAGDAPRRARPALLRSLVVITLPVVWPLMKLGQAWMRRDPQIAAGFHDLEAARLSRELGPDHRATLRARADHAAALSKLGELPQAEEELAAVISQLNPLADGDDRLLLYARRWHHHVLVKMGRLGETEADARFVAESYARQLGPDHPDTLYWRQLTAIALWGAGRRDEAIVEMTVVAAWRAATQGASHPDTLKADGVLSSMKSNENASFRLTPPGG